MEEELTRRLHRRAKPEETVEDVCTRLLNETINEMDLETVLSTIHNQVESPISIYVTHLPSVNKPTQLEIVVYTSEADGLEDPVDLFEPHQQIVIERDDGETLRLPFSVRASCGGPKDRDTTMGTPVYMHENVLGPRPLDLEVGTTYLKNKLANPDQWDDEPVAAPINHINKQVE